MEAVEERGCVAPVTRQSRQPRPGLNNGTSKRIWLLLYSEGGWWVKEEIRARLHLPRSMLNRQVFLEMVERGAILRRVVETPEGQEVKYGVDKRCKVPRGVTVEELWDILQITAQGKR